eukprot:2720391-Rhodomonas_salina.1
MAQEALREAVPLGGKLVLQCCRSLPAHCARTYGVVPYGVSVQNEGTMGCFASTSAGCQDVLRQYRDTPSV